MKKLGDNKEGAGEEIRKLMRAKGFIISRNIYGKTTANFIFFYLISRKKIIFNFSIESNARGSINVAKLLQCRIRKLDFSNLDYRCKGVEVLQSVSSANKI